MPAALAVQVSWPLTMSTPRQAPLLPKSLTALSVLNSLLSPAAAFSDAPIIRNRPGATSTLCSAPAMALPATGIFVTSGTLAATPAQVGAFVITLVSSDAL